MFHRSSHPATLKKACQLQDKQCKSSILQSSRLDTYGNAYRPVNDHTNPRIHPCMPRCCWRRFIFFPFFYPAPTRNKGGRAEPEATLSSRQGSNAQRRNCVYCCHRSKPFLQYSKRCRWVCLSKGLENRHGGLSLPERPKEVSFYLLMFRLET